jgi:uncharacterized protein (TIGR00369 family)
MNRKTTNMIGRAETIHSGNQVGLSTLQITDQKGRMLAFGSTRCLISDVDVDMSANYPQPDLGATNPSDPYLLRPPDDGYFNLDQVMYGIPIDLQRMTVKGEKIFPVWRFTGYRPTYVDDGLIRAKLPSSAWFSNGSTSIYGGLLSWAAEFTMGAAVYSTLGPGDVFATLDMHIRFIRPAFIDSGDLSMEATVNHRGKRLRVSSCNVDDTDGNRIAMATSSALIIEGGVHELSKGRLPDDIIADTEGGAPFPL